MTLGLAPKPACPYGAHGAHVFTILGVPYTKEKEAKVSYRMLGCSACGQTREVIVRDSRASMKESA